MDTGIKEVRFDKYCRKCRYRKVDETKEPCNECLSEGGRLYSHKPSKFEKGVATNGRKKSS